MRAARRREKARGGFTRDGEGEGRASIVARGLVIRLNGAFHGTALFLEAKRTRARARARPAAKYHRVIINALSRRNRAAGRTGEFNRAINEFAECCIATARHHSSRALVRRAGGQENNILTVCILPCYFRGIIIPFVGVYEIFEKSGLAMA